MTAHHKKAHPHKRKKNPKLTAFLIVTLIGAALPALAVILFLASFDLTDAKKALERYALEQTGRSIALKGPIEWDLSYDHGLTLDASDVMIGNAPWASRKEMAHIGKAKLHLDVKGLLQKKLTIVAFNLFDTDIQFETAPDGKANWDLTSQKKDNAQDQKASTETSLASSIDVHVKRVGITRSRIGYKPYGETVKVLTVPEFSFMDSAAGIKLRYRGRLAEKDTEIRLTGGTLLQLFGGNWPFTLRLICENKVLDVKGSISRDQQIVKADNFTLRAGQSTIKGQLTTSFAAKRPSIKGDVSGGYVDLKDFAFEQNAQSTPTPPAKGNGTNKLLSREPLPLDVLKVVDLDLGVMAQQLVLGMTTVDNVSSKITLSNGLLTASPIKAKIAGSAVDGQITLDASEPTNAKIGGQLKTGNVDLLQLFKVSGLDSFISGKSSVHVSITSFGKSTHEMASHAEGFANILMDTGTISQTGLRKIAGDVLTFLAPGTGSLMNPGVNCMAARYVIKQGLLDTKGFLLDTETVTVAGDGYINLPDEHISMSFRTRPKSLGLASMIPSMRVMGDVKSPKVLLDAASTAQKIKGLVSNEVDANNDIPPVVKVAQGNACAATLDNPQAAKAASISAKGPIVPSSSDGVLGIVKELGNGFLGNLGGQLFGK